MSPLSCPQVCTDLQVPVSANWLHSPSRLCHREGAFTQFTFQNGQESRKWLTIQICHVLNAWEAKKPLYGTKNLSKGAKTRVRVLADIQNFALRAHCVHGIPHVPTTTRPKTPPLRSCWPKLGEQILAMRTHTHPPGWAHRDRVGGGGNNLRVISWGQTGRGGGGACATPPSPSAVQRSPAKPSRDRALTPPPPPPRIPRGRAPPLHTNGGVGTEALNVVATVHRNAWGTLWTFWQEKGQKSGPAALSRKGRWHAAFSRQARHVSWQTDIVNRTARRLTLFGEIVCCGLQESVQEDTLLHRADPTRLWGALTIMAMIRWDLRSYLDSSPSRGTGYGPAYTW